MLSHDVVFQNAKLNFAIVIARKCSPTVLAMELGAEKEIESLLAVATVDDLYNRDSWSVQDGPCTVLPAASLNMDPRPVLLDISFIWIVFWRRENGLL